MCTKIGTTQRRLAWPLCKDDTQIHEVLPIFKLINNCKNHGGPQWGETGSKAGKLCSWEGAGVICVWGHQDLGQKQLALAVNISVFGHSYSVDISLHCSWVLLPKSPAFQPGVLPPTQLHKSEATKSRFIFLSPSFYQKILHKNILAQ